MKLSAVKDILPTIEEINFILPDGKFVPKHFHVTEVGGIQKHFIDCGGTVRTENVINFQLWEANDFEHRLAPKKLLDIINLSENVLGLTDQEIEVEYQGNTIGKYGLVFENGNFLLTSKTTDCLAKDNCGIPADKLKVSLSDLGKPKESSCCTPGGGCC
ncbi:MAG: hypothetical protein H6582_07070 [Crocinitomicaceae bacterium]|nr:hypothetical protein [Crocinitomicaceae bacterium]